MGMKIKTKVTRLKSRIAKLVAEVMTIQEQCPHTNVEKVAKSDTGNYCKSDDRYWYECRCPECQKFWDEDQ